MLRKIILFLILVSGYPLQSLVYRPVNIVIPDAASLALGGGGVSRGMDMLFAAHNPAALAEIMEPQMSFGMDALTRIDRLNSDYRVDPEYVPLVGGAIPLFPDSSAALVLQSPFSRRLDDEFIAYSLEAFYARSLSRNFSLGVSAGAMAGLQAKRFDGWGFTGSVGLLFRQDKISIGLSHRPGASIRYPVFTDGNPLEETFPGVSQGGISFYRQWGILTLETDYIRYSGVRFVSLSKDYTPQYPAGAFHPHIGAQFPVRRWPGITLYTGLMTEDYYDYAGKNDPQIIWTFGVSGIAGRDFWQEKLKISFGYASSFIPSAFAQKNNQIERMILTFSLYF